MLQPRRTSAANLLTSTAAAVRQRHERTLDRFMMLTAFHRRRKPVTGVLGPGLKQCRINHVADVANATGLSGASGSR